MTRREGAPRLGTVVAYQRSSMMGGVVLALLALGCGAEVTEPADTSVASIEVTSDVQTLSALGATAQLTAQALTAAGTPLSGKTFAWSSSERGHASVDAVSGVVTAVGNGLASISATVDGVSGQVTLEVAQQVTGLRVNPDEWILGPDDTRQLFVQATDAMGATVDEPELLWESSNESVVRVDELGLAAAVGLGSAQVTATAGSEQGVTALTVGNVPVDSEEITYTTRTARAVRSPVVLADGSLYVRYGAVINSSETWTAIPRDDVTQFQWEGGRVGALAGGALFVVDQVDNILDVHTRDSWISVNAGTVARFELEGNRIGTLMDGGAFFVQDGIGGNRTTLASRDVIHFQLEGNRIGMLVDDGTLRVKDGINGGWAVLASSGVIDFQLEGNRIGMLMDGGAFFVQSNVGGDPTTLASRDVADFQLEGNRIGMLMDDGALLVQDGIGGNRTAIAPSGVIDFQLEGNWIGMLMDGGSFSIEDGIGGNRNTIAPSGVIDFQLEGNRIGMLMDGGSFFAQDGIGGDPTTMDGPWGSSAPSQFRVGVLAPVIYRTTSQYMAAQLPLCVSDFGIGPRDGGRRKCYPVNDPSFGDGLVDRYGRWCGGGIPTPDHDYDLEWFDFPNPQFLDAIDGLCREHDWTAPLYPGYDWFLPGSACILRFGIEHDVVTIDGATVPFSQLSGRPLWQATVEARNNWLADVSIPCSLAVWGTFKGDEIIGGAVNTNLPYISDRSGIPPNWPE